MTDGFLGTLHNPAHDVGTSILKQVIRVILNITAAFDLCMERNDDQSAPGTFIRCTDLRQMVCVQNNSMRRDEAKRVLELLLGIHNVSGTKLFQYRSRQAHTFLQLGCNNQTFAFEFCHFWLYVSATPNCQCICGHIAGIGSQHSADGIPEGTLAITALAIGNNQRFQIHLANSSHTDDFLNIVDQRLVMTEEQVQRILPDFFAVITNRAAGNLRNQIFWIVLLRP